MHRITAAIRTSDGAEEAMRRVQTGRLLIVTQFNNT